MPRNLVIPPRSDWWFNFIRDRIAASYLRKHCHAFRLSLSSATPPADGLPILVVMNHPSWWDPLMAFVLSKRVPGFAHFGVIDQRMLGKYRILRKAGLIGIDLESLRGAAEFLKSGQAILAQPRNALWVTAQGEFVDVRRRPLTLRPGVGHLAARMTGGWVWPVALEIGFWNERTPEALAKFGAPIPIEPNIRPREWNERIERSLTQVVDELAVDSISRDTSRFETMIAGSVGVGGFYDLWRRLGSAVRGKRFDASHGGEQT